MRFRGEVEQQVHLVAPGALDVAAHRDVAAHEAVPRVLLQPGEVLQPAGVGQLVEDGDPPVGMVLEGEMGEVRTDETGAAGDQDVLHRLHRRPAVSFSIICSRTSWLARNSDSKVPASVHHPSSTSCSISPRRM